MTVQDFKWKIMANKSSLEDVDAKGLSVVLNELTLLIKQGHDLGFVTNLKHQTICNEIQDADKKDKSVYTKGLSQSEVNDRLNYIKKGLLVELRSIGATS